MRIAGTTTASNFT